MHRWRAGSSGGGGGQPARRSSTVQRAATAAAVLAAATALGLAGCGGDDSSSNGASTAGAPTTAARLAPGFPVASFAADVSEGASKAPRLLTVVAAGHTAVAYLCNGADEVTWFAGTAEGNRLSLRDASGRALDLAADGDRVTGTLGTQKVDLPAVSDPAGLYVLDPTLDEAFLREHLGGWIVLPDGTQTGGVRSGGKLTNPRLDVTKRTADIDGSPRKVVPFSPTASAAGFQFQLGGGQFGGQFGGQLGGGQFGGQFGQFGGGGGAGGGGFQFQFGG